MSSIKVVRYRTKAEFSEENAALVSEVFEELAVEDPGGLRYFTLRLEDGVSFVHIAFLEGENNPLGDSPAFRRFSSSASDRCDEGPIALDATLVGSYPPDWV